MAEGYEQQTSYNVEYECYNSAGWQRIGQHLTIPNRLITKVGFWVRRIGTPNGTTYIGIWKADDTPIAEETWGLSNDVPLTITYIEVTLGTPVLVNGDSRIFVRTTDGQHSPQKAIMVQYQNTEAKAGESFSRYSGSSKVWTDLNTEPNVWDTAYKYTYQYEKPAAGGGPANLVAAGII